MGCLIIGAGAVGVAVALEMGAVDKKGDQHFSKMVEDQKCVDFD